MLASGIIVQLLVSSSASQFPPGMFLCAGSRFRTSRAYHLEQDESVSWFDSDIFEINQLFEILVI